jgi:hypothetical protein
MGGTAFFYSCGIYSIPGTLIRSCKCDPESGTDIESQRITIINQSYSTTTF